MAYTHKQKVIARKIVDQGHRMGKRRDVIKTALATAIVESKLGNPTQADSDSDSAGPFQQRPSQGWGTVPQVRNVRHAAASFYRAAAPLRAKGVRGGALAQAVQRSAYPGRYRKHMAEAGHLLTKIERRL